jgi:hypothetical protein
MTSDPRTAAVDVTVPGNAMVITRVNPDQPQLGDEVTYTGVNLAPVTKAWFDDGAGGKVSSDASAHGSMQVKSTVPSQGLKTGVQVSTWLADNNNTTSNSLPIIIAPK